MRMSYLAFLILSLCSTSCAKLLIISTNDSYIDRPALFGPRLSENGVFGYLVSLQSVSTEKEQACVYNMETPQILPWIALVHRGGCTFADKVRTMQKMGASAVIIGNNDYTGLMTMAGDRDTSDITIPALFISQWEYVDIRNKLSNSNNALFVHLSKQAPGSLWNVVSIMLIVMAGPLFILAIGALVVHIKQRMAQKFDMAAADYIRHLPTRQHKRRGLHIAENAHCNSNFSSSDHDICAICLEVYSEGDILRILPCHHEYHKICVDPWLIQIKRICPLCKRDAYKSNTSLLCEKIPLQHTSNEVEV